MSKDYRLARRHDRLGAFIGRAFSRLILCALWCHGCGLRLVTDAAVYFSCKFRRYGSARGAFTWTSFAFTRFGGKNAAFSCDLITLDNRVSDSRREQANGAQRVVVSWDDVIDSFGRTVCVDHGDDRNSEAVRFSDRNLFLLHVDDEDAIGKAVHRLDAREVLVQALALAIELDALLLGHLLVATISLHAFEIFEPFDRLLDRLKVSEQTTEPSLIDVILTTLLSFLANGVLRLSLGADEENCLAFVLSDEIRDERDRLAEHSLSLLQIDDVNAVALAEDIFLHLRVPAPYLVAKVNTGLQQLFHGNRNQTKVSFWLIGLMYSPQPPACLSNQ